MTRVPPWIGAAGFVLTMIFCLAFLGGQLWVAIVLLIPGLALAYLETRYARQTQS